MRYAIVISTILLASTAIAGASQGSNGKYCLNERNAGEGANCSFQTLAQCLASKTGNSDSCTPNPRATTGSGGPTRK